MSRYIDADELYVDWYDSFVADDGTEYENIPLITKGQIDDAPTIDIERKHGEWIDSVDRTYMDRPMAECSECGWYINPYWINEYNFCPNCGADMRGSGNETI